MQCDGSHQHSLGCIAYGASGLQQYFICSRLKLQSLSSFCNRSDCSTVICNVMAGADKYS
jgi:hypothetical protein